MGSDELVERLRAKKPESDGRNGIFMVPRNPEGDAAADEIERLTAQVEGCTIMAEGFKARVAELTAQLAEARESERAAVVAWLRGLHWTHAHNQEALFFAAAIEDKVHLT